MVSIRYLLVRDLDKRKGASSGGGGRSSSSSSSAGRSSSGSSSKGSSSSSSSSSGSKGSTESTGSKGSTGSMGSTSSSGKTTGASSSVPRDSPPGYTAGNYFGGGAPRTVSAGTPFAGRNFGGGTRSNIYGSRGYGGGYGSYAAGGIGLGLGFGYVGGLGFPYGYWPLYYGHGYYGDDEYGPHSNSSRPGGALAVGSFSPSSLGSASTASPEYMLYGDAASVTTALNSLVGNCTATIVVNTTAVLDSGAYAASPMSGTNSSATLLPPLDPANVLSYYRSSSFALYSFFSDSTSTDPAATTNYTEAAGTNLSSTFFYPASARDSSFETCINSTLAGSLPLEEGYVTSSGALRTRVSAGGVAAAALAVVFFANGAKWQMVVVVLVVAMALSQQA